MASLPWSLLPGLRRRRRPNRSGAARRHAAWRGPERLEGRILLSFAPAVSYAVGEDPRAVAVGDFDGDGVADLAVANVGDDTVGVLLGAGDGTFGAPTQYIVGTFPESVAVGDFDGDGAADLATANFATDTVGVLLGAGDGTFGAPTQFPVGDGPRAVAVGDFDGDGAADLVVTNFLRDTVSVLLGAGGGTFGAQAQYAVGTFPGSVAVGDFDSDGAADLATANAGSATVNAGAATVSVLLNQADTTTTLAAPAGPTTYGQVAQFTAAVTADGGSIPTGSAQFTIDGADFGDPVPLSAQGTAILTTATLPAGVHEVTARYLPDDPGFVPSATAGPVSHQVTPAPVTVTLASSADPAVEGRPVALTALVAPADPGASAGPPAGWVTFALDGRPIGAAPLVDGRARLEVALAGVGPHLLTASYAGGDDFTPGASAPLAQAVIPDPAGGPKVVGLRRYGLHAQPTRLVLAFSSPLDPARAADPSNYRLRDPGRDGTFGTRDDRRIPVRAATYDPAAWAVTLRPALRLSMRGKYQLTVVGTAPRGLADPSGRPLNGEGDGRPGTDYLARFDGRILAGPAGFRPRRARSIRAPGGDPGAERGKIVADNRH